MSLVHIVGAHSIDMSVGYIIGAHSIDMGVEYIIGAYTKEPINRSQLTVANPYDLSSRISILLCIHRGDRTFWKREYP